MNQKAALPPLISHGLDPAEHFVEALRIGREPLPTERPPLMDPDLEFVASLHVREGATPPGNAAAGSGGATGA